MLGRSAAVAAAGILAFATAGPAPAAAAAFPAWPNDPDVYLSGVVRCPSGIAPNWVWLESETGERGYADLAVSPIRATDVQYSRLFAIVPTTGVRVVASWSCGLFDDLYSSAFVLRRAWWGRELTVNLCPASPCVP